VLKITRPRDSNKAEFFEFKNLDEDTAKVFDVLAIKELDTPLWNVPEFFSRHMKDLVVGQPVNEFNPKLVLLRFG